MINYKLEPNQNLYDSVSPQGLKSLEVLFAGGGGGGGGVEVLIS